MSRQLCKTMQLYMAIKAFSVSSHPFISQDVSQESTQCECNLSNMFTEVVNFWIIAHIPLSFSVLAYQKVTERIYFLLASPTNHSMQSCILLHTHQHNQAELLHQAYFWRCCKRFWGLDNITPTSKRAHLQKCDALLAGLCTLNMNNHINLLWRPKPTEITSICGRIIFSFAS